MKTNKKEKAYLVGSEEWFKANDVVFEKLMKDGLIVRNKYNNLKLSQKGVFAYYALKTLKREDEWRYILSINRLSDSSTAQRLSDT